MDSSARDDPKLREVKAVLHHLQGLPSADLPLAEPEPPLHGRRMGMLGILIAVTAVAALGLAAIPSVRQLVTSWPKGATVAAGPQASETTALKDVKIADPNSTSVAKASVESDAGKVFPDAENAVPNAEKNEASSKAAVEGAVTLMNRGQVQAARKRLLALATDGSPDVLWALARSFDPTVLAEIPAADASPNVPEAERWYRAWHAAAVKQGLVRDSGSSLERIIGSMRRP
jgi:hypothetical protein